jgi:CRISPR-associated protein Cas2
MNALNCFIVSYDIMDPKRWRKVHQSMLGFGEPIHYSVFRCDLSSKGHVELMAALDSVIKHDEDRIMIVDLGPAGGKVDDRIEFMGVHPESMERKAVIL